MATWEETKRVAQSVYNVAGQGFDVLYRQSGFQSIYNDIGSSFQQFLIAGHVYPPMERNFFNYEIAQQDYHRDMETEQPQTDRGLEPER
jgi:hypothetical protein